MTDKPVVPGSGLRESQPYRVHLPGFLVEEEIGLGDVIKKAAAYTGFSPCGGCGRRAMVLNGWLTFAPRSPK